jgi:hypothetical protein
MVASSIEICFALVREVRELSKKSTKLLGGGGVVVKHALEATMGISMDNPPIPSLNGQEARFAIFGRILDPPSMSLACLFL